MYFYFTDILKCSKGLKKIVYTLIYDGAKNDTGAMIIFQKKKVDS